MGTKTMTRDLRLLQDQLNAIAFVLKERGCVTIIPAVINHNIGVVDFSGSTTGREMFARASTPGSTLLPTS